MARIQARKGKKRITYTATVRVKGYPPLARTFDTRGEAKQWAAETEKEMRMNRYQDVRPIEKIPFADILEGYLAQVSINKALRRIKWI